MRYLLLFGLVFLGRSSQTLNIVSYGAVGDGVTDNTTAINACFTAAASQGKSVYVPTGVYACNNNDVSGHILTFNIGALSNITIYGDGQGKSVITTSDTNATNSNGSTLLYLYSSLRCYGLTISGLTLRSTHGITQKQTTGIFYQGTSGQLIDTTLLVNTTLSGFQSAVGLQGINGINITSDSFYSPNGHDCGQHGSQNPVAFITGYDNANGLVNNCTISGCYANGYTGPIPLNCPRPQDNFVYGTYYGITTYGNTTRYFSQEIYLVNPQTTNPSTTAMVNIGFNNIDQSLPPGCVEDNGSPHKYNYGVRSDANNTYIHDNNFLNYTTGILTYTVTYTSLSPTNFNYYNNHFVAASDTSRYTLPGKAINVVGYTGHPITGVNITNNTQSLTDSTNISTTNCTSPYLYNNPYSPVMLH